MFCKNCGNSLADDRKFCNRCGYELQRKSAGEGYSQFLSCFFIIILCLSAAVSVVAIVFLWNQDWIVLEPLTHITAEESVTFSPIGFFSKLKEIEPKLAELGVDTQKLNGLNLSVLILTILHYTSILVLGLHIIFVFFRKKALILSSAITATVSYLGSVLLVNIIKNKINEEIYSVTFDKVENAIVVENIIYVTAVLLVANFLFALIYVLKKNR